MLAVPQRLRSLTGARPRRGIDHLALHRVIDDPGGGSSLLVVRPLTLLQLLTIQSELDGLGVDAGAHVPERGAVRQRWEPIQRCAPRGPRLGDDRPRDINAV